MTREYNEVNLNLSVERVLQSVYALAAMRRYDRGDAGRPEPIFCHDSEDALRRTMSAAMVNLAGDLFPLVTGLGTDNSDTKSITLRVPFGAEMEGVTPTCLLLLAENALVTATLALATSGVEEVYWATRATEAVRALRAPLDSPRGVRLAAGWY